MLPRILQHDQRSAWQQTQYGLKSATLILRKVVRTEEHRSDYIMIMVLRDLSVTRSKQRKFLYAVQNVLSAILVKLPYYAAYAQYWLSKMSDQLNYIQLWKKFTYALPKWESSEPSWDFIQTYFLIAKDLSPYYRN